MLLISRANRKERYRRDCKPLPCDGYTNIRRIPDERVAKLVEMRVPSISLRLQSIVYSAA
jgi:hypothetical protein